MGIAAEVGEDLLRAGEGTLGVDDEVLGVELVQQAVEATVGSQLCWQVELSVLVSAGEVVQKLAAVQPAQKLHGKQILPARREPPLTVEAESSTGDDGVHMRMEAQVPGPGVQHHCDAEQSPEPLGVLAKGQES